MNKLFWIIVIMILIGIPTSAYVDTIRGVYPYQQYLAICLWEAGLLIMGMIMGYGIKILEEKQQ